MRDRLTVALVYFSLLFCSALGAQAQEDPCPSPGAGSVMMPLGLISPRTAFSGVVKTSFEQKLYDGNTIRSVTRSREARDAAGRTRTESHGGCMAGDDGQMHAIVSVSIHDPAARTSTNWQEGPGVFQKIATVIHQPPLVLPPPAPPTPEELEQRKQAAEKMRALAQARRNQHPAASPENLGTKQINGMLAKGLRITTTIAASEQGNDLPIVTVHETWQAVGAPGLILMQISDDPRRGRTVSEFEELKLGEPDPGLFAPPADYKIREVNPNVITSSADGVVTGFVAGGVVR